jgi:putative transposase
MSSTSRRINTLSARSGPVYGARYHSSLVGSPLYFGHVLKYIYRNPVRARLTEKAEDYPFSSLRGLIGIQRVSIPVVSTLCGYQNIFESELPYDLLPWLNVPFHTEQEDAIRSALHRKHFKIAQQESENRIALLNSKLL